MSRDKRALLSQRMKKDTLVVAPGVFDMISAKIADRLGFECLYVTGYGVVASHRFSAVMGFDDIAEFDRRYRGE